MKQNPYALFKALEHWKALKVVTSPAILLPSSNALHPLFSFVYEKMNTFYSNLPRRKNGDEPFIHPLNVVLSLKKAGVSDPITFIIGLLHDFIEEEVDIYKQRENIKEDDQGIVLLDTYEEKVLERFEEELRDFCVTQQTDEKALPQIVAGVRMLTRHKRDYYYESILSIYLWSDEELRNKVIQVKLADRTHNILCLDCFTEKMRLYQCFKNLFILNNTKKYLLEKYGQDIFNVADPTEQLFKRCAKATYDAFMIICALAVKKGIQDVRSMLQLAFKKFALEKSGVWAVTDVDEHEMHPIKLYQGVVRKYDARLHHEWEEFKSMADDEQNYCKTFFADYGFSDEQIQALLDYKDAYALKEVVAYLMYLPEYKIGGFEYNDLFRKS